MKVVKNITLHGGKWGYREVASSMPASFRHASSLQIVALTQSLVQVQVVILYIWIVFFSRSCTSQSMCTPVLRHAIERHALVQSGVPLHLRVECVLRVHQIALDERQVEERLGGRDLECVARTLAGARRVVRTLAWQQTVHSRHERRGRRRWRRGSREWARHRHRHRHGHRAGDGRLTQARLLHLCVLCKRVTSSNVKYIRLQYINTAQKQYSTGTVQDEVQMFRGMQVETCLLCIRNRVSVHTRAWGL